MFYAVIAVVVLCFAALVDIHRRSYASWIHADRRRKHWLWWGWGLAIINLSVLIPGLSVFVLLSCIAYLCCYFGLLIPSMRSGQITSSDFRHPDH